MNKPENNPDRFTDTDLKWITIIPESEKVPKEKGNTKPIEEQR